jgi:PBP1b-binding outer membrane lipoprotein LpoB|tara:strand:- start:116 stop:262 length:147 start_codon:yes stop_codon:yes gene_type:complete
MRILSLVIFSALFLSGCPGKATPPQTTREEPPKYYKKSKGYYKKSQSY